MCLDTDRQGGRTEACVITRDAILHFMSLSTAAAATPPRPSPLSIRAMVIGA